MKRPWSSTPSASPRKGSKCDASLLMDAYMKGWRRFITFDCIGQRYIGCGLGPETDDVTIDVYGSSGDYLASGIDGLTITVHGNAQDQLGQIIKRGKLVIHGDVGQTFMYGAKGGEVYVMGQCRRTAADQLRRQAEGGHQRHLPRLPRPSPSWRAIPSTAAASSSSTASDSTRTGALSLMDEPYPGSNLFSLASGGAIYVRDPGKTLVDQQLQRRR